MPSHPLPSGRFAANPPPRNARGRGKGLGRIVREAHSAIAGAVVGAHVDQRHHALVHLALRAFQRGANVLRLGHVLAGVAAQRLYLCVWIRKIDRKSISLYWALAAFVTGFLFSWILWIVVIFEIREDLLDHYNTREPIGLRLNWVLTFLFSIFYFQYHLRPIAIEKERPVEAIDETRPTQRIQPTLIASSFLDAASRTSGLLHSTS